jgi:hypothetical protein
MVDTNVVALRGALDSISTGKQVNEDAWMTYVLAMA